jgi:hypothetical protein
LADSAAVDSGAAEVVPLAVQDAVAAAVVADGVVVAEDLAVAVLAVAGLPPVLRFHP